MDSNRSFRCHETNIAHGLITVFSDYLDVQNVLDPRFEPVVRNPETRRICREINLKGDLLFLILKLQKDGLGPFRGLKYHDKTISRNICGAFLGIDNRRWIQKIIRKLDSVCQDITVYGFSPETLYTGG